MRGDIYMTCLCMTCLARRSVGSTQPAEAMRAGVAWACFVSLLCPESPLDTALGGAGANQTRCRCVLQRHRGLARAGSSGKLASSGSSPAFRSNACKKHPSPLGWLKFPVRVRLRRIIVASSISESLRRRAGWDEAAAGSLQLQPSRERRYVRTGRQHDSDDRVSL